MKNKIRPLIIFLLWLTPDIANAQFTTIFTGLNEAGGLEIHNNDIYVSSRDALGLAGVDKADLTSPNPSLTRVIDSCGGEITIDNNYLYVFSYLSRVDARPISNLNIKVGSVEFNTNNISNNNYCISGTDMFYVRNINLGANEINKLDFSGIGTPVPYPYYPILHFAVNNGGLNALGDLTVYNNDVYFSYLDNNGDNHIGRVGKNRTTSSTLFDTVSTVISSSLVSRITELCFDNGSLYLATHDLSAPLATASNVYRIDLSQPFPAPPVLVLSGVEHIIDMEASNGDLYLLQYDKLNRANSNVLRKVPLQALSTSSKFLSNQILISPSIVDYKLTIEIMNIHNDSYGCSIFSSTGVPVKKINLINEKTDLYVGDLRCGVYFIRFTNQKGEQSKPFKFVKS